MGVSAVTVQAVRPTIVGGLRAQRRLSAVDAHTETVAASADHHLDGYPAVRSWPGYSHSMVPGGLDVTSRVTRLISRTSLVIRVEMRASTS